MASLRCPAMGRCYLCGALVQLDWRGLARWISPAHRPLTACLACALTRDQAASDHRFLGWVRAVDQAGQAGLQGEAFRRAVRAALARSITNG